MWRMMAWSGNRWWTWNYITCSDICTFWFNLTKNCKGGGRKSTFIFWLLCSKLKDRKESGKSGRIRTTQSQFLLFFFFFKVLTWYVFSMYCCRILMFESFAKPPEKPTGIPPKRDLSSLPWPPTRKSDQRKHTSQQSSLPSSRAAISVSWTFDHTIVTGLFFSLSLFLLGDVGVGRERGGFHLQGYTCVLFGLQEDISPGSAQIGVVSVPAIALWTGLAAQGITSPCSFIQAARFVWLWLWTPEFCHTGVGSEEILLALVAGVVTGHWLCLSLQPQAFLLGAL